MARNTEDVAMRLKLERAGQFRAGMKGAGKAVRGFGKDASWAGARARMASKSMDSLRGAGGVMTHALTRGAQTAGLAVGALGFYALKSGVQFNATMQQNKIAFTQFLGSTEAANKELSTLYDIAKTTPFSFTDVTLATRKFLAFGFSVDESNKLLRTTADTASGLALDAGGINRMVMAIGQIKSKGTLSMEDLRQLQELGAVDVSQLAKDLGVTREEMANIGKEHIPAEKALKALQKQWGKTFGGMSEKQAQTLTGQWSTMKDNWAQLTGAMTSGLSNPIVEMMKGANGEMSKLVAVWQRKGWDFQRKLQVSKNMVVRFLRPYADQAIAALRQAHLGDRLSDAFEEAAPKIANAAADAAPHAASAFVNAWLNAGPWGKLLTLAFLSKKLGVFGALGNLAASRFVNRFSSSTNKRMASPAAAAATKPGMGAFAKGIARIAGPIGAALLVKEFVDYFASNAPGKIAESANPEGVRGHHVVKPGDGPTGAQIYGRRTGDPVPANSEASKGHNPGIPQPKPPRRGADGKGKAASAAPQRSSVHVYLDSDEVGHRMLKKSRDRSRRR